ncbi:pentapeptide repeat-containing protein [Ancylothrix sp. C2]|uniref:pentapeptide repeat-containing protein n=1 Tax=Ancylothrix sp. D3o TaxID=2953691 RepID=UPI0035C91FCF|nr:pentapeptide repeat-containing protein [Ancylothrix sp. D3o]
MVKDAMGELMEKMTVEELLSRYAAGERDFHGIMLIALLLNEGVNLRGADFRNACINNANLRGVDLQGSNK